jgi:uncharacterized protein
MDLTLDRPGDHLYIRSVSHEGFTIGDECHPGPIIVSASQIITDWPATTVEALGESLIEPIVRLEPEVVLLGTGAQQVFLPPELMVYFFRHQAGLEVMTTDAACRTFNVLVSESRNVVAALLPIA